MDGNGKNITLFEQFKRLRYFRDELYLLFPQRADAIMDLIDAISSNTIAASPTELSLNPLFQRQYRSVHVAIKNFAAAEKLDSFQQTLLPIVTRNIPEPVTRSFYLLAGGMILTAIVSIMQGHKPVTTFWGIVVSVVSIAAMQVLIHYKMKVGTALNSPAILADAACTRTCLQLSVVLLLASSGYALTGIGYLDAIGSLIIAILSIREGREASQKANGLACSCSCSGTCDTAS